MDTKYDFMLPEFLNILFFQQKNIVIFPYVDLKHLKTLEIFTAGHNVIDLESTALYNLEEIIYEANNSYSQERSFFFIYGLDSEKLSAILKLEDIRCVLRPPGKDRRLISKPIRRVVQSFGLARRPLPRSSPRLHSTAATVKFKR